MTFIAIVLLVAFLLPTIAVGQMPKALLRKEPPKNQLSIPTFVPPSRLYKVTSSGWRPIGPAPATNYGYGNVSGRITSIAVDPTNFDVVYASAATGGLWKSVNGGDTWTPLTDYLPRLASGSVAIDPTDPNTIYYGEGECNFSGDSYPGGGIFKSTDGGQSWQQLSINTLNYTSRVIVAPSNHNIVYVGGYRDIYKSTDAGQDWVELNLTNGAVNGIAVNPTDANVIYAGKGSLWGGADTSYGVFKSTDGGSSWTKLNNGLPGSSYCGRVEIALSPSTPNVLYVGIWGSDTSRVFRSSDGGSSWTPLSIGNYGGGQGWYNNCVSVSPQDPNSVFVGGIDFWHTTNGGTNWTNLTQSYAGGYIHPDQHAIAFAPSNPNVIYIGNDGGVWKSTDGGRTFINCNSNLAITQFYRIAIDPENPLLTYGGTQDNGTLKNTQPSLQWDMIYGGDGGQVIVDPKNSNIILLDCPSLLGAPEFTEISDPNETVVRPGRKLAPLICTLSICNLVAVSGDILATTGTGFGSA